MPRPVPHRTFPTGAFGRALLGRARRRPPRRGPVGVAVAALAVVTLGSLPAGGSGPAVAADQRTPVGIGTAPTAEDEPTREDEGAAGHSTAPVGTGHSTAPAGVGEDAAGPASFASRGTAAAAPHGELRLTLTGAGRSMSWTRGVDLSCPDGAGRHPEAARACAELDTVGGQPSRLPGGTEPCTREYAPVTATAEGVWRGREVSWQGRYATLCELRRATGAVFRF